eukprot:COSAG04_NODE_4301_length_2172_cov_1.640135_2_plen_157_part_00
MQQDGDQDAVTTAQAKLDDLGQLFYSSIGEVWQQAAPVPVGVGPQPVGSGQESAPANAALAHQWAAKLGNAARELQSAVDQLGSASRASDGGDGDSCRAMLDEEERSIAEGEQLLVSIASAEQWLLELQQTIRLVNGRAVAAKTARAADDASEGAD